MSEARNTTGGENPENKNHANAQQPQVLPTTFGLFTQIMAQSGFLPQNTGFGNQNGQGAGPFNQDNDQCSLQNGATGKTNNHTDTASRGNRANTAQDMDVVGKPELEEWEKDPEDDENWSDFTRAMNNVATARD